MAAGYPPHLPATRENAFARSATRLTRESEAGRGADSAVGRSRHIVNPERVNRLGRAVAYAPGRERVLPSALGALVVLLVADFDALLGADPSSPLR